MRIDGVADRCGVLCRLAELAVDPSPLTRRVDAGGASFVVRALRVEDAAVLALFLAGLGDDSRRFWHGEADPAGESGTWVDAIGRYDKLRLVAHRVGRVDRLDAVVDLSFSLPAGAELSRYASYGLVLDPARTVRFGPCVADAWQGSGLAAGLLPPTWDAVRLLGRDCVVLFGGVRVDNHRARRFYRRHGFVEAGAFTDADGENVDMVRGLA
jgi:ribosomal protein S18 acetylase RimI-like enzyme